MSQKKTVKKAIMRSCLYSFACAGILGSAAAQDVPDDDADDGEIREIEVIVVTATKRGAVSLQDVPAAIKAVTGDYLDRYQLKSFEDAARIDPSLQFAKAAAGDLQPIIRGIQSPGAGTVGVYFDETVITGANFDDGGGRTPDIGAYDLERLEVLKGPQGTLFGASSMTGTVRIISNKPSTDAFDARISARGFHLADGGPGYGGDIMLNVPVVEDVFALRAVGWYEHEGGFIDHYVGIDAVTLIEDANELEKFGGRIMARLTPSENITLDAYAMYQDLEIDGPQGFSDVPTGVSLPITIVAGPPFVVGREMPPRQGVFGDRILSTPSTMENSSEVLMYGATVEYDTGVGTIVATASKFEQDPYFVSWDTSGNAGRFFLVDPVGPTEPGIIVPEFGGVRLGLGTPFRIQQTHWRDLFSAEVRYSSGFDGPFNFVVGAFYQDDESEQDQIVLRADPVTGQSACRFHAECIADPTSPGAQALVFGSFITSDNESYALFTNVDIEVSDALTLGGGLRYYDAEQRDRNFSTQSFQGSNPPTEPPAFGGPVQTVPELGLDDTRSFDKLTWDASVGFQPNDGQLYYFRAATGFRQGGINDSNQAAQLGVTIPEFFDPDTVRSLEIGAKTSWLEDRITANLALFRMKWKGIQVPGQDPTGTVPFIDNAAEAAINGVEFELAGRIGEQLLVNFGVAWIDAKLTEDQIVDDPTNLDFPAGRDGDRIPKVPEWALSGSAEYALPTEILPGVATSFKAFFSYTGSSKRFLNDSFENNFEIGDYFLLDFGLDFTRDNWQFGIFVKNATDESPVVDYFANGADAQQKVTVNPRAIGARVTWNY